MLPTLKSNDIVITSSLKNVSEKDVVVLNTILYGNIIKRVSVIDDKKIDIESDNKETYSSACQNRYFMSSIVGKVIFKINAENIFSRFLFT